MTTEYPLTGERVPGEVNGWPVHLVAPGVAV
jgi:hypothetical protein